MNLPLFIFKLPTFQTAACYIPLQHPGVCKGLILNVVFLIWIKQNCDKNQRKRIVDIKLIGLNEYTVFVSTF